MYLHSCDNDCTGEKPILVCLATKQICAGVNRIFPHDVSLDVSLGQSRSRVRNYDDSLAPNRCASGLLRIFYGEKEVQQRHDGLTDAELTKGRRALEKVHRNVRLLANPQVQDFVIRCSELNHLHIQ
jgi:hypothetical protein